MSLSSYLHPSGLIPAASQPTKGKKGKYGRACVFILPRRHLATAGGPGFVRTLPPGDWWDEVRSTATPLKRRVPTAQRNI